MLDAQNATRINEVMQITKNCGLTEVAKSLRQIQLTINHQISYFNNAFTLKIGTR